MYTLKKWTCATTLLFTLNSYATTPSSHSCHDTFKKPESHVVFFALSQLDTKKIQNILGIKEIDLSQIQKALNDVINTDTQRNLNHLFSTVDLNKMSPESIVQLLTEALVNENKQVTLNDAMEEKNITIETEKIIRQVESHIDSKTLKITNPETLQKIIDTLN